MTMRLTREHRFDILRGVNSKFFSFLFLGYGHEQVHFIPAEERNADFQFHVQCHRGRDDYFFGKSVGAAEFIGGRPL